ncbi:hypothetical protein BCV70DRAFT_158450 [Testicularia cyperi]|uniref:SDE2-like domain-containing protein n=1 Tax=Testicularia cyperi TaxID=1882483 RepID=A0A317XVW2_9BASI|nr:hypothetical protein BCV70DRAFT_158450 [Testicularia cyperi]
MVSILVESFSPLPRHLCLHLPPSAMAADVVEGFQLALGATSRKAFRLMHNGRCLSSSVRLSTLGLADGTRSPSGSLTTLQLRVAVPGGKGGFGSMLRSQGGKMSSGARNTNNDSCRDLNGRRLGVAKEAQKLADHLQGESERKHQMDKAQQKKYAKLERMLKRTATTGKDLAKGAERMADAGEDFGDAGDATPSPDPDSRANATTLGTDDSALSWGSKRKERVDDTQYIEQSREIVESVRSAVATAMMKKKKKKKQKLNSNASKPTATASTDSKTSAVSF